jgi:hypothetical protein
MSGFHRVFVPPAIAVRDVVEPDWTPRWHVEFMETLMFVKLGKVSSVPEGN